MRTPSSTSICHLTTEMLCDKLGLDSKYYTESNGGEMSNFITSLIINNPKQQTNDQSNNNRAR